MENHRTTGLKQTPLLQLEVFLSVKSAGLECVCGVNMDVGYVMIDLAADVQLRGSQVFTVT